MDGCVDCGVEDTKKGGKGRHTDYETTRYREISTQNNDAELFFPTRGLVPIVAPYPVM